MKVTVKLAINNGAQLMAYRNDKDVPINHLNDCIGTANARNNR